MFQITEVSRVYRGFRRRINRYRPLDSFPFLSGDSYLYSCQLYFGSGLINRVPSQSNRVQKEGSLFVTIGDLKIFIHFLEKNLNQDYSNFVLVLHNGDETISADFENILADRFRRILSVNQLVQHPSFIPIPIGLENKKYFTNGVPSDFQKLLSSGLKGTQERKISMLQAFSLHTNPKERGECLKVAEELGCSRLNGVTAAEYRKALSESKFVLSPAGNGFDCHRTWEAMYLGAIPIVRREHWPFSKLDLPVLQVDEWADLLNMDLNAVHIPQNSTWDKDFWDSFYND